MFAITNHDVTLFLSTFGGNFHWSENPELAHTFKTEGEATVFEDTHAREFLQCDTLIFSYVNDISHLIKPLGL